MIPEKRVDLLVEALPLVFAAVPQARAVLFGQGPERERIVARIAELGIGQSVATPGFVEREELDETMCKAAVVVQPSAREGYGLVVVEAAARGVPVVAVTGDDNAATELIAENRNGFVAKADCRSLADAIIASLKAGGALRASTRAWYAENSERLSLTGSQSRVEAQYRIMAGGRKS
jgi:glycosyltransferase involved in cell wall biosynthesis